MPKKTNKTSHVLNLITNGAETEKTAAAEDSSTAGISAQVPESASVRPASGAKEGPVVVVDDQNDQISEKIRDSLERQLPEPQKDKEEYHIVNVMEDIISRTNLKNYMEQYEVCTCSRCQADVKALILTRLPAKYVVVYQNSVAPIIGFYENKFRVRIFTEILKSCMQVKEKPRHEKERA